MSDDLEARLAAELAALPGPSPLAEAGARRLALAALPPVRRRRRWPLLAVAAAVAALVAGTAALARIGAIHVAARPQVEAPARLALPRGARGILVVADGRLWLTMRDGTRIERLPVSAAELSPHALYVAAGIGTALVVTAPDGRRAWAHAAGGTVEAVAWAPDGLRVAYVVRRGGAHELWTIEGDGDHARLLDAAVRPVEPSWRADSLALAYVGRGGRAVVYDLGHRSRRLSGGRCAGAVQALAFASAGRELALAGRGAVAVDGGAGRGDCLHTGGARVSGLAWVGRRLVFGLEGGRGGSLASAAVGRGGALAGRATAATGGDVRALAPAAGGRVAVALRAGGGTEIVLAQPAATGAPRPGPAQVLLRVAAGAGGIARIAVR